MDTNDGKAALMEREEGQLRAKAGKYLTFKLSTEEYGLEILTVKEIIGLLTITKMPRTPDYIRGVINLRGKVIPVTDLRIKFGMEPHRDTTETCIIVVEISHGGQPLFMGILVDSVSEVLNISQSELEDAPTFGTGVNTEFIQGMGKVGERVIILLDIDNVISGDDLRLTKRVSSKSEE